LNIYYPFIKRIVPLGDAQGSLETPFFHNVTILIRWFYSGRVTIIPGWVVTLPDGSVPQLKSHALLPYFRPLGNTRLEIIRPMDYPHLKGEWFRPDRTTPPNN